MLIGMLRHDRDSLRLALLSPQGQRLLTLVRDQEGIRFLPGAAFEPPFTAEWLASRLSWSLWPAEHLRDAFDGSDWTLEATGNERWIRHRGRLVAQLVGGPECRIIHDLEGGYRLAITAADHDRAEAPCRVP